MRGNVHVCECACVVMFMCVSVQVCMRGNVHVCECASVHAW